MRPKSTPIRGPKGVRIGRRSVIADGFAAILFWPRAAASDPSSATRQGRRTRSAGKECLGAPRAAARDENAVLR